MSEKSSTWGGKREGAGRPKLRFKQDAPHRRRPALDKRHPTHVVLRTPGIDGLRTGTVYRAMREVLRHFLGREDFRVCHLSIQENHLHFLIEAAGAKALSGGMRSLSSRAAHAINRAYGQRRGKVFRYRYHSTPITTARQARNSLAYVLNNWRKHQQDWVCERASKAKLDPYSSAISFNGWNGETFSVPTGYTPLPVSPPTTSLLRSDWKRYGHIGVFEIPSQRF